MKKDVLIQQLRSGGFDDRLEKLYGTDRAVLARQRERYLDILDRFTALFPTRGEVRLFSASGRTEIGGNHTDHQRGCALGAAIDLDAVAVVAFHNEGVIRFGSVGHRTHTVELADLTVQEQEKSNSISLIRGIAARFTQMGAQIGGFDAYAASDILSGSGLSSSAAFETLVGTIINIGCFEEQASAIEIAKIGQYAENVYYDKKSGLLDQAISSVGGFVFLDFLDSADPRVSRCHFDFHAAGYDLCITDTKGSHADLTDDYTAVPTEMKQVARQFGKEVLREVDEEEFRRAIPRLRGVCSDRAILRAIHFFQENRRASKEADALSRGDTQAFFRLYRASAESSATLLQNLYSTKAPLEQGIPLGLAYSRLILGEDAAVRVHGGGFAGTIQAFVPRDKTRAYVDGMNALFGDKSCYVLHIRPFGGVEITDPGE